MAEKIYIIITRLLLPNRLLPKDLNNIYLYFSGIMNENIYDVIKKNKEIPFIIAYFIFILASCIYLVLDYWHPIPIQNFDYSKLNNTEKYANGTEKYKITHSNQTMKVETTITKQKALERDENNGTQVFDSIKINETGTILQNNNNNRHNFNFDKTIDREFQLILLALLFGIIGGTTHGLASLVTYVGNKKYNNRWTIWYVGRPAIGGIMAIIFYVLIRGGLLSVNAQPTDLNYFGIAAISVVAGLMATEATGKIRDIFMTLFGTEKDREKGDEPKDTSLESRIIVNYKKDKIKVNEVLEVDITVLDFKNKPLKEKEIDINLVNNVDNIDTTYTKPLKTGDDGKTKFQIKGKKPGFVKINVYLKDDITVLHTTEIEVTQQ